MEGWEGRRVEGKRIEEREGGTMEGWKAGRGGRMERWDGRQA